MIDIIKQLRMPGYDLGKEQAIQRAIAEIRHLTAEVERLNAKIAEMEKQEPVAFALYSGWARKAVYLSETEACDQRDRRQLTADLGGSLEAYRVVPLYTSPGAQPAPSVPEVTDAMAIAFHAALTDGSIGQQEVEGASLCLEIGDAAVGRQGDLVAGTAQRALDELGDGRLVLGDQDPGHCRRPFPLSRRRRR